MKKIINNTGFSLDESARIAMRYGLTEKHVRALVNAPAGQADLFGADDA